MKRKAIAQRNGGPKRAAIYDRVSTDEQAEKGYSLPTQLEGGHRYAQAHGFTVTHELADDCSGSIPVRERPAGKKLYELVDQGELDAVIIFTHDRTARDERVLEYLLFKDYLHEHGVELHYSDTGLDPYTMEGNLVGYIKSHASASERLKIIERTKRGKNAKAQTGKLVMIGHPPYGYQREGRKETAKLIVYDPEARVVKVIYVWYVYGENGHGPLSLRAIAIKLEQAGEPTPHYRTNAAQHWIPATIRGILANEIYAGRTYYGKSRMIKESGKRKSKRVKQAPENWIAIEVPDLAIIDRDLFEAAQARAQRNLELSRRSQAHPYLLSGFFRCRECDGAMAGTMVNSRHKGKVYKYPHYRCGTHWHHPDREPCPNENKHVPAHLAEAAVWDWLSGLLQDEKKLDKGLRAMEKQAESEIEPKRQRLEQVKRKMGEAEQKVKRLVSRIGDETDDLIAESLKNELKMHAKQAEGYRAESLTLERELSQKRISVEMKERIRRQAAEIRQKLTNPTFEQKRALFDVLNLHVIFRIDDKGRRWLDCRCGISPEGHPVVLSHSSTFSPR
jgi:site-specific DNA recombinase